MLEDTLSQSLGIRFEVMLYEGIAVGIDPHSITAWACVHRAGLAEAFERWVSSISQEEAKARLDDLKMEMAL